MKKIGILAALCLTAIAIQAQVTTTTAYIYNDDAVSEEVKQYCDQFYPNVIRGTRQARGGDEESLGALMKTAAINAAKGIGAGYVTSFIDLGVTAVVNLMQRKQRIKAEWESTVQSENVYLTSISSISNLKDFYSIPSINGPLDPKGMRFNGIGCLRMEGNDTVFYISMHIDKSKINRIVEHSKFELVLDTLIISPFYSNLPNSSFDTAFSYEDRQNYCMSINIDITSSWMNQATMIQEDVELGHFSLYIPVRPKDMDSTGFVRYVRHGDEESPYPVNGSSFIVPRSYSGFRENNDEYHDLWGTGEYQISMELRESCTLTKKYKDEWRKNRRERRRQMGSNWNLIERGWQTVTAQQWDEITQSWVLTVLQAPADVLSTDLIDRLHLNPE